ncbi:uncharacterized protein LOC131929939 [Physella acuta]|uniref:uncharacterized protein LOC131929939 n=1 Tax=Physella acuta TaxID=109671 RepID=UPI0027DD1313|nr:uncharacterized protein LOC131929939 [Physella acuta]
MVKLGLLLCVMTTPLTVLGVSTQMGRLFLFIPIKMHDEGQHLAIFFFTMAHNKVSVKVTFPWYKGEEEHISKQPDHQTVDVDRMGTSSLMLHQDYYIRENCGPSFTYKFEATDDFGINVLLEQNQYSVDTFTAVPITGWGKTYYTMQLDEQQAFTVANGETENKVSVTFKSLNKDHKVDYKGKQYKDGETLEVDLKKFEGFSIQLCWDNREQWVR